MKVALFLNWGLGLEILKTIHPFPPTEVVFVITQFEPETIDVWKNVVYDYSLKLGYKTIPQNMVSFDTLKKEMENDEIDLLISHAFMKIFPKSILTIPKFGCINIHPSLLPKYRGPSPTKLVLKNKDKITGLTAHYIDEGIDTGSIIYQLKVSVKTDDTEDTIIEKMKSITKPLILETFSRINDSTFEATPQIML